MTLFLNAEPLPAGKRAVDLEAAIRKTMKMFGLKMSYLSQGISDEEGAVQNCLVSMLSNEKVYVCLAHKLQTIIKHAFQCSAKAYKRDYDDDAFMFFERIRKLIAFFTSSPKRTRALKRLQDAKSKVGLLKFSTTRRSGCYNALGRLNRLKNAIIRYFHSTSEKDSSVNLDDGDWRLVPQILLMLDVLNKTTVYLQYKELPVFSMRLVLLNNIRDTFKSLNEGKENKVMVDSCLIEGKLRGALARKMCKRFLERFNEAFARDLEASAIEDERTSIEKLVMFCDPRTRKHSVSYAAGKFAVSLNDNLVNVVDDLYDTKVLEETELESRAAKRDREEQHYDKLIRMSPVEERCEIEMTPEKKKSSLSSIEAKDVLDRLLTVPYSEHCSPFHFLRKEVDARSPFNAPETFWHDLGKKHFLLMPIAKRIVCGLTMELTSTFQESVFSYGGSTTTGTQNRTGPLRLSARAFVRFNYGYVAEEFEARFNELIHSAIVADIKERYKKLFEAFNDEEDPLVAQENLGAEREDQSCPICFNINWMVLSVADFPGQRIRCDEVGCSLGDKPIPHLETFLACQTCNQWDICMLCLNRD